MGALALHYVDLRAFAYGTERDERVAAALRRFLPEEATIDRVDSEGHMGDPIGVFSARIESADGMRTVLDALADLPAEERGHLSHQIADRIDDNTAFYMTLDKQAACEGSVRLGDGITLRAKIEAYPATREGAIENAREVFGDL
ncbi:MAG: RNA-binding protein [Halococcoides sp.]